MFAGIKGGVAPFRMPRTELRTRKTKSKNLKRKAHGWSLFNRLEIGQSNISSISSSRKTPKPDHQGSESRFDSAYPRLTSHFGEYAATAGCGLLYQTVFSDELSESNTEIILCKHIFCGISGPGFPPGLRSRRSKSQMTQILVFELMLSKFSVDAVNAIVYIKKAFRNDCRKLALKNGRDD
jgi:hypothetical protein